MDSKPSNLTLKIATEPPSQFEKGSGVVFKIRSSSSLSKCGSPLLANLDSIQSFMNCFDFNFQMVLFLNKHRKKYFANAQACTMVIWVICFPWERSKARLISGHILQGKYFILRIDHNCQKFQKIKFIYSEKATKFWEIFPLLLTTVHTVKSKGKISQNFVAFSEYIPTYMNFY